MADAKSIQKAWEAFHEEHPGVPLLEASIQLEISEAELLASFCGNGAYRLRPKSLELIQQLSTLGPCTCQTRNLYTILEKISPYLLLQKKAETFCGQNSEIEIYLFEKELDSVFALREEGYQDVTYSFQFFDAKGKSIHKIFFEQETVFPQIEDLIQKWQDPDQNPNLSIGQKVLSKEKIKIEFSQITSLFDYDQFCRNLEETPFLALKNLGEKLAQWLNPYSLRKFLLECKQENIPLAISLSNHGALQICHASILDVQIKGPWLIAKIPNGQLKIRHNNITSAWRISFPRLGAENFYLEMYDKTAESMFMLGCLAKEKHQQKKWQELIKEIPKQT